MQWYEILIIIAAVGFVVWVAARGIVRRKKTPRLLRMLFGMCRVRHVQRKKEYRKTKIKITDVFSGLSRLDPA